MAGELAQFTGAGLFLQNAVTQGQPLVFDSERIMDERGVFEAGGPTAHRRSATWDLAYAAFKRGEQLALPHYEERPTDPVKQQKLSAAYARFRAGELPIDQLPNLADIYPDDPRLRAEIGLATEPDATPAEALIQACGSCHNDVLDQTLSRARFNIDLTRMSRAELDLAIARIELPREAIGAMPPPGFRQLTVEGGKKMVEYLKGDQRAKEDDEMLTRAAKLGMAGPGPD
jgi:mono/diheme cytochrome c family protein